MNLIVGINQEDVKNLIASADDDNHTHILAVDKEGNVMLVELPDNHTPATWWGENKDQLLFRFQSFHEGGGYTGKQASTDSQWIDQLYRALLKNWELKTIGHVDNF